MRGLTARLDRLEASATPASDPAIRQWLGIELSDAERAELAARPSPPPMSEQQIIAFDAWWHGGGIGPVPCEV